MGALLITGASGFLGWHSCRIFAADWEVYGTYHNHPISLAGIATQGLNLTCEEEVAPYWQSIQPDAVLHTAAISKVGQCQQNPEESYCLNVTAAVALAKRCAAAEIPFLFTSTDLVFDGTQAPYSEVAAPTPVNRYGEQKAAAESAILQAYPDATICRLPLLYGAATPTATCFLQDFTAAIAAGKSLTLFTDEVRTPAEVTDVVQGLSLALEQGITGLLHLGGPQRLNRYEFGQLMAAAFDFPETALKPCRQASVALSAPRPKDVSLDSRRAFALGYAPRPVAAALAQLK